MHPRHSSPVNVIFHLPTSSRLYSCTRSPIFLLHLHHYRRIYSTIANHFPFLLLFFWISTASSYLSLPDTSMVSSSSFVPAALPAAAEDIAPLPLIRCPRCNLGVIQWFISETPMNPGRHFYKCQFRDVRICPRICIFSSPFLADS
uniref:Zinc finger GRF-type domain-containing protein n=1 Tax=Aegilops tauschii subsp. strangulata TaxID=200361 RepID=A0A453B6R1_AEGTS